MVPRAPKTKEQVLQEISNEILDEYMLDMSGLCKPHTSITRKKLTRLLDKAEKHKEGNYADYHYIYALMHTVLLEYGKALNKYKTALNIAPNDVTILSNYAALLLETHNYKEAAKILEDLILNYKVYDETIMNNFYRIILDTLDFSLLDKFRKDEKVQSYLGQVYELQSLHENLSLIDISIDEYRKFMRLLTDFICRRTRQSFKPRFTINRGLDRNLKIEIFLNVNVDQASQLDSEFQSILLDYVFEHDCFDFLGKFIVFFRQLNSRYDGIEKPDALFLGMNEELIA